jgi:hypothetical protein
VTGIAVVAPLPLPTMKPVLLLTLTETAAVPPTATGKVVALFWVVRVKVSVVAVTVRLTVVVIAVLPLVPVTVMACAPEGNAMLAAVVMVRVTVDGVDPVSETLPGLKLQSAPAGSPAVQLPGVEFGLLDEFAKVTEPVKPLAGVIIML